MRIGIIGAGNIGGNCAQRFIISGKHEVKLSFSRDPANDRSFCFCYQAAALRSLNVLSIRVFRSLTFKNCITSS